MIFFIDAAWSFGRTVTANDEAAFRAGFRPGDESISIWIANNRPGVLRVNFHLDGVDDYEDAVNIALDELRALDATIGITGKPIEIVAATRDGMARWEDGAAGLTG